MPLGHWGQLTSAPNVRRGGSRPGVGDPGGGELSAGRGGTRSPLVSVVGGPAGDDAPDTVVEPVPGAVAGPLHALTASRTASNPPQLRLPHMHGW